MKTFHNKQKIKEYMTAKPILKGLLHRDDENKHSHERMGIIKSQEKIREVVME
jgi:hypothetical protein